MNSVNKEIEKWFGFEFLNVEKRFNSYSYLSNYIALGHTDWKSAPDTDTLSREFTANLKEMADSEFAFLLCHAGYIPEVYKADSSQETLYTKLIEGLACEWARRLGFHMSVLPKQKASKEDVTISDGESIIVCDAKSYRLGRSQAAPNVKDALKKSDITKWLSHYESHKRIGGLVTFPSQHDWKNGSDFYLYLTDKKSPIVMVFYEHMTFMLLAGMSKYSLLNFYKNHEELFPVEIKNKSGSREIYFQKLREAMLDTGQAKWGEFSDLAEFIVSEKVSHTKGELDKHLESEEAVIQSWVDSLPVDKIKEELIAVRYKLDNHNLLRQRDNIVKFRKILRK